MKTMRDMPSCHSVAYLCHTVLGKSGILRGLCIGKTTAASRTPTSAIWLPGPKRTGRIL